MTEHTDVVDLDDPTCFWAKWFWTLHCKRSDAISIAWSKNEEAFMLAHQAKGRTSRRIRLSIRHWETFSQAASYVIELKACYLGLRCQGERYVVDGELTGKKSRSGYNLSTITFSHFSNLWAWMDQMSALRQAAELDAHTAPALKQGATRDIRL